jgi:Fic family protein
MKKLEKPPFIPQTYNYANVLDELIEKGKYSDFVSGTQTKYLYWEKWKYMAKDWAMDPKMLWGAVKSTRHGVRLYLKTLPTFSICSPTLVQGQLHECDMNLGGNMQGESIVPAEEKDRYLISSLMEEAIASSQLEGADTARKFAKEMLANNRKPGNISERMIVNNYAAMQWIVKNKHLPISPENICKLHSIITNGTLTNSKEEGVFRTDNEVVVRDTQTGEILHQPPLFEALENMMIEYCDLCNDKNIQPYFIHPVSKGIILHFLMGYIHPFSDGNGRTARTIFYWYLIKKGYWLIEYMSVSRIILQSKAKYARAYLYTETDGYDLTYFIVYNLECIIRALSDLKAHIKRKASEKKDIINLMRNTRWNNRQITVLQEIIKDQNQSFSVRALETWFGISNQTARNDLSALVEANLLEERKSGRKILYHPVPDVIDRIEKWNRGKLSAFAE